MSGNQDRDQQILSRLARIEHRVDSIDQTTAFALRAEAEKHSESVRKIFRSSKRRAQVYLAADGARGVGEIAAHLRMKRQNVGAELRFLSEHGLLELASSEGGRDIWVKKALDRTLRISHQLRQEFDLNSDGSTFPAKSGRNPRHRRVP
jgi:hypothetical protein